MPDSAQTILAAKVYLRSVFGPDGHAILPLDKNTGGTLTIELEHPYKTRERLNHQIQMLLAENARLIDDRTRIMEDLEKIRAKLAGLSDSFPPTVAEHARR